MVQNVPAESPKIGFFESIAVPRPTAMMHTILTFDLVVLSMWMR